MAQDGGKVVSLTHRPPLAQRNIPGTHFCYRLGRPQSHSAIGGIISMKNSNDTIWNRTSDLPIVAQHLNHCATAVPHLIAVRYKMLCNSQLETVHTHTHTHTHTHPNIEHRLTLRVSPSPNFTTLLTGHGNINSYLHKFKITENPGCPCNKGNQTVDHIIYSCGLHEQERKRLKAATHKSGKWPASKNTLPTKYYKHYKLSTDTIVMNTE